MEEQSGSLYTPHWPIMSALCSRSLPSSSFFSPAAAAAVGSNLFKASFEMREETTGEEGRRKEDRQEKEGNGDSFQLANSIVPPPPSIFKVAASALSVFGLEGACGPTTRRPSSRSCSVPSGTTECVNEEGEEGVELVSKAPRWFLLEVHNKARPLCARSPHNSQMGKQKKREAVEEGEEIRYQRRFCHSQSVT